MESITLLKAIIIPLTASSYRDPFTHA